jgi:hypothetical protein
MFPKFLCSTVKDNTNGSAKVHDVSACTSKCTGISLLIPNPWDTHVTGLEEDLSRTKKTFLA